MDENIKARINKVLRSSLRLVVPIILIIIILLIFFAGVTYWITIDDGTYKEDDWGSTPYAASTYASTVKVAKDGTIKKKTTVNDLWEKMKKNDSRVDKYLDSPEELARLMKAEIVTQYPDTRDNPDKEINWKDIVDNEDDLQGIVKFKRANENGKTETMKYAAPATFQGWIDAYNNNGDNSAKKEALSHFTLRKSSSSKTRKTNSSTTTKNSGNAVNESKMYFIGDSWVAGLQSSGVAKTSYFYGQVGRYAGSPEMSISNIPEKNDASAIVLYLGVNNPSSYSEMNSLIDELVSKYSGKPIYVVEVSPIDPDKCANKDLTNDQIENYNEIVKKHCDETENVTFLSIASNVTDSNGKLKNTTDGLHLNSYQDWYDGIISAITKGTTGQTQSNDTQKSTLTKVDGDGYNNEYTSSAGITYKCYKQYEGSYSGNRYWKSNPVGTIKSSGCGPTSVAILTSGLRDASVTPAETAKSMYDRHRIYGG